MRRAKITVIGGGNVGASCALWAASKELGDIVVLDIPDAEGMVKGKMLDLAQCSPIERFDADIIGTADYADTAGSDVVVVTAGLPRKPGMSRDDLIATNVKIVKSVAEQVAAHSPDAVMIVGTNEYGDTAGSDILVMTAGLPRKPGMSRDDLLQKNTAIVEDCIRRAVGVSPDAIVIMVTNPLDAMCEVARRVSGFPRERVIGMAGILDSARMRSFMAMELGVSVENTHAFVLGGHGDSMVPLARYSTVAGVPLTELLPQERIESIVERTRKGGGEIVGLLKTGSAYYAPGLAVAEMVEAILRDKHKILPCAAYLDGEYGIRDTYAGVPIQLGRKGMEKIVEIDLTDDERGALQRSAAGVKELIDLFPEHLAPVPVSA